MSTLKDMFAKVKIPLYQNESLDLDHYYQEPFQDVDEENPDLYKMDTPFESDPKKQKRNLRFTRESMSLFHYFMDGSRRTYKIGDIVLQNSKIYPVVIAQVRAGCGVRDDNRKIHKHILDRKNLLLITSQINTDDFAELKLRIQKTPMAKMLSLDVEPYKYDRMKDLAPTNAAIAKANSIMHEMEISILGQMVKSNDLDTDKMLIVDGPLQFLKEDKGKSEFADLFYNVVGVSKSFDPMLPISERTRGGQQIGSQLLNLNYSERTPVFYKKNNRGRVFGCWYLRIRHRDHVNSPLEGIVKIEKMASADDLDRNGFESDVIDNISRSILEESIPTCHGRDDRWAAHLYPVYLTETMVKASFMSDLAFINQFKKSF